MDIKAPEPDRSDAVIGAVPGFRRSVEAFTVVDETSTAFPFAAPETPSLNADDVTLAGTVAQRPFVTRDANLTGAMTSLGSEKATDASEGPLKVGERFGTRYRIIRVLGIGGMGAVYEAWDAELGVDVALKVIRPEVAGDSASARDLERRFKRELLLARQVTHKNVVRIHDLGELDGIKYITMPYVDGQDLGTILKDAGRLPVPRALSIARQALSGLVAAHGKGIVHRDLKPANIMVDTAGEALLMDFGIARSVGVPTDQILPGPHRTIAGAFGETMVGAIVGTIHYMAPEQAQGRDVDHRADIYAFGLILRDMLVGLDRHMGAPTALAELQRRMDEVPPPLRTIDATMPESLDRIVSRCLAPDPSERYQTTEDLEADLNRLDDNGVPLPVRRVVALKVMIASVAALLALSASVWWFARGPAAPVQHDPVTVVIADIQNSTNDATFDRTLEQTIRRALEGASFISAYDRSRIRPSLGVSPPAKLDESAARQLAVNQGLGVIVSTAIARRGTGYELSVKVVQALTGKEIAAATGRAANKDQVLETTTKLANTARKALGDETSNAGNLLAMKSISTTSLEVASLYAAGIDAQSAGRFEDARQRFLKAVELDPKFGLGYQGLALMSRNLGRLQDAEKYAREALSKVASMTDRERVVARGNYYNMVGDYQQCVKEYGELLARYPADTTAHNQRAICFARLRNMREAMHEMQQAVRILPRRVVLRSNLALFADYAGEFATAEREVRALEKPDAPSIAALALSQLGQGLLTEAGATYQRLGTMGASGQTYAASGLGDLALYQGRFSEAAKILEQGVAADLELKNGDAAAMKLASLAYVHLMRGQSAAAVAAADRALLNSSAVPIQFLAARVLVEAGAIARARSIAMTLASEVVPERQAFGKIVLGDIALKSGDAPEAIKVLTEANNLLETWLGHFDLGRAYLRRGDFPKADGEFDLCIKRRGEALSLLDQDPTYGYFPPVYYFQGLARQGMNAEQFAASYQEYINIRGKSTEDPLLRDVRRRAGL